MLDSQLHMEVAGEHVRIEAFISTIDFIIVRSWTLGNRAWHTRRLLISQGAWLWLRSLQKDRHSEARQMLIAFGFLVEMRSRVDIAAVYLILFAQL